MTINLTLRSVKGSQLTSSEADANFIALRDAITAVAATAGVSSWNTRTGAVTLTAADIINALGYTPAAAGSVTPTTTTTTTTAPNPGTTTTTTTTTTSTTPATYSPYVYPNPGTYTLGQNLVWSIAGARPNTVFYTRDLDTGLEYHHVTYITSSSGTYTTTTVNNAAYIGTFRYIAVFADGTSCTFTRTVTA